MARPNKVYGTFTASGLHKVNRYGQPKWGRGTGTTVDLKQDYAYDNWIVSVWVDGERTYTRESNDYDVAFAMYQDALKYCPA